MDHDQENFYQEEQTQSQAESQQDAGREVNDMTFFIELMKHLRTLIERGNRVPLSNKVIVDAGKCAMILDELDKNLPDAIQYGMQMYSERDRLLGDAENDAINRVTSAEMKANKALENARREAERIVVEAEDEAQALLDDAHERAEHMINESEIVRQAREEARNIKNDARVEAGEVRLKASHDAYRLLTQVESQMDESLKELRKLRSEMTNESE